MLQARVLLMELVPSVAEKTCPAPQVLEPLLQVLAAGPVAQPSLEQAFGTKVHLPEELQVRSAQSRHRRRGMPQAKL